MNPKQKPTSQFRLSSSSFERTEENCQITPKKIIFLSVEGAETEKDYFTCLNKFLNTALIQIEVLHHHRKDGYSVPTQVIELKIPGCIVLVIGVEFL